MKECLIKAVRSLVNLPPEEENKLLDIARLAAFRKGELFIREGQHSRQFGFVGNGLFRYYYVDDRGNEYTKGFFPEHTFLSSYSAMVENRGSFFNIEALEDAEIVIFDYSQWQKLYDGHPAWKDFLVASLQRAFLKKESREREFLLFDAETRYRSFLQEYPRLDQRIKQHMIASYLGITPVALSRIRKKMGLLT